MLYNVIDASFTTLTDNACAVERSYIKTKAQIVRKKIEHRIPRIVAAHTIDSCKVPYASYRSTDCLMYEDFVVQVDGKTKREL